MEMIDAKTFLEDIENKNARIQCKLAEIQQLRSLATSISSLSSETPVQSSSEGDRIGKIIASIVDKEKELDAIVDDYIDEKEKRIKLIEQLDDSLQYKVLHKRYVELKSLSEIASEECYTYDWIGKKHSQGLKKVQEMLNELCG